jgi:TetR/AcrR family transcriptional regulator, transcriptional repressor for nem operon
MKNVPVLDQILDLAQSLVQLRGYNAMSYRDLADEIGIKTSSIHYYFPSKEDLGLALMQRYRLGMKGAIAQIENEASDPKLRIKRFIALFVATVRVDKICLGGMFASDTNSLPELMQNEVREFYIENEAWLSNVLKQGREQGQFSFSGSPKTKAEAIFSALEGVMITARLFNDEKRLITAGEWILHQLEV